MVRPIYRGTGPYLPEEDSAIPEFNPPDVDNLPTESGVQQATTRSELATNSHELRAFGHLTPQLYELLDKIDPQLPLIQQILKLKLTDGKLSGNSDKVGKLLNYLVSEIFTQALGRKS